MLRSGIRDVAREADVSVATVSRAFNRPDAVNAITRQRVFEAAKRLMYIPDSAARSLSSQRSFRVGAIIPTIDDSIFARFVEAMQRSLGEKGYGLLIGVDQFDPQIEYREIRAMIESGIDAVILCGARRPQETYDLLKARRLPYVVTNIYAPDSPHISVGYDNKRGASKAADYLLDLGHRTIGVIDYPGSQNDRAALRVAGIIEALERQGVSLPPALLVERPYSIEDGRVGLRILMAQRPAPTAVICGNDILGIGALFEAQEESIAVPERLSIIGFDNLELGAQITPGLTTLHVPTGEMGARTAEVLLLLLEGRAAPHATRIGTNLIVRGTTGPPPEATAR